MARNRMIKAEFWKDSKVGRLSLRARLLFIGMWNFADDSGVVRGDAIYLRSEIFTYDRASENQMKQCLSELVDKKFIVPIHNSGEDFFLIKNFKEHQVINRPSSFRFIQIEDDNYNSILQSSVSAHGDITNSSLTKVKEKVKVKEKKKETVKEKVYVKEKLKESSNNKLNNNIRTKKTKTKNIKQKIKEQDILRDISYVKKIEDMFDRNNITVDDMKSEEDRKKFLKAKMRVTHYKHNGD